MSLSPSPFPRPFRLKILHLNDLHGRVANFAAGDGAPVFSRIAWRVRQLRQRYAADGQAALLFVSAGDEMVGSPLDLLLGDRPDRFQMHAAYRLYAAAGLDAAVLGNHDLDRGATTTARAIAGDARFPVLAANLRAPAALAEQIRPAVILEKKGVRIGLIGLTTPAQISTNEVTVTDPREVLRRLVPELRPHCDLLVVLSHLGYSQASSAVIGPGDVELARSLPAGFVDLIIGGHSHTALNEGGFSHHNYVNGMPIVQAGMNGRYLGEVTFTFPGGGNGGRPVLTEARLVHTDEWPADREFEEAQVQPLVQRVWPEMGKPIGIVERAVGDEEVVQNHFAAGESALANFITAGMVARARAHGILADLAMLDRAMVCAGLPAGRLTLGDWLRVMPYADRLMVGCLTGAQLQALIADNALRVDRPDEPYLERGFVHFSGPVQYVICPGRARGAARVSEVWVAGRPLAEQLEREFTVIGHSFFRALCRPWAVATDLPLLRPEAWPLQRTELFVREEMLAYIQEQGGVTTRGGAICDGRVRMLHNH